MAKLYVVATRSDVDKLICIESSDVLLFAPGVDGQTNWITPNAFHVDSFDLSPLFEAHLSNWVADRLFGTGVGALDCGGVLQALSNDGFAYVLRPLARTLLVVRELVAKFGISNIVLVGPRPSPTTFAFYGVQNAELSRGSFDVFGALIVRVLRENFGSSINVDLVQCKQDLASRYQRVRQIQLSAMNWAIALIFTLRCLSLKHLLRRGSKLGGDKPDHGVAVIVRAFHQVRFAASLVAQDAFRQVSVTVICIPQFVFGGLKALVAECERKGLVSIASPSVSNVMRSLWDAWHLSKALGRCRSSTGYAETWSYEGINLTVRPVDVARDLRLMWVFSAYPFVLRRVIETVRNRRIVGLISFELVGRQAVFERIVAGLLELKMATIQTAVVSARPHPLFPVTDRFYCDSSQVAGSLNLIGSYRAGNVEWAGSCIVSKRLPQSDSTRIRRIVFFTQPYEPHTTRSMLLVLAEYSADTGGQLLIKLHPRDSLAHYEALVSEHPQITILESPSVDEAIRHADLAVSRTSSVLREAISLGCPVVACVWSGFDRTAQAAYLEPIPGSNHVSHDEESLRLLLVGGLEGLERARQSLEDRLNGGLGPEDLAKSVVSHLAG